MNYLVVLRLQIIESGQFKKKIRVYRKDMEYSQNRDSYKGTVNAEINIVPSL